MQKTLSVPVGVARLRHFFCPIRSTLGRGRQQTSPPCLLPASAADRRYHARKPFHRGEPALGRRNLPLPVRRAVRPLHSHQLPRGAPADMGVEGPHQAPAHPPAQGGECHTWRAARQRDALLLVLHHPRARGPVQERCAVLGGYIIPHDLSHPEPGHHRATAGVLRTASYRRVCPHHLRIRDLRWAPARQTRLLALRGRT